MSASADSLEQDDGPAGDRPMSLSEHLDELRGRLLKALVSVVLALAVCAYFHQELLEAALGPAARVARNHGLKLIATGVTEQFFTEMHVVIVAALFLSGPLVLYQMWGFVATGLYDHEKRWVRVFAPVSYVLFAAGCVFMYFVAQPLMLEVMLTFMDVRSAQFEVMPQVADLVGFFLGTTLVMGIVFELPLVLLFVQALGMADWRTFSKFRRHFLMIAVVLAAVITPTGDAVSLAAFMVPIVLLFEIGILLCRFSAGRKAAREG